MRNYYCGLVIKPYKVSGALGCSKTSNIQWGKEDKNHLWVTLWQPHIGEQKTCINHNLTDIFPLSYQDVCLQESTAKGQSKLGREDSGNPSKQQNSEIKHSSILLSVYILKKSSSRSLFPPFPQIITQWSTPSQIPPFLLRVLKRLVSLFDSSQFLDSVFLTIR